MGFPYVEQWARKGRMAICPVLSFYSESLRSPTGNSCVSGPRGPRAACHLRSLRPGVTLSVRVVIARDARRRCDYGLCACASKAASSSTRVADADNIMHAQPGPPLSSRETDSIPAKCECGCENSPAGVRDGPTTIVGGSWFFGCGDEREWVKMGYAPDRSIFCALAPAACWTPLQLLRMRILRMRMLIGGLLEAA